MVAVLGIGSAVAQAAEVPSIIVGGGSGKCIDVLAGSQARGTQTVLNTCSGSVNQTWTWLASKQLKADNGRCLDVYNEDTTPGTKVIIWACKDSDNQKWNVNSDGTITSVTSGLCLDVTDASKANDAPLELWTCYANASNQIWAMQPIQSTGNTGTTGTTDTGNSAASTTTGVVRGFGSGRCVEVPGSSTTNGTRVTLQDCNGGTNQLWAITTAKQLQVYGNKCLQAGDTTIGASITIADCKTNSEQQWNVNTDSTITNVASGLCLEVTNSATVNGAPLELWTCTGASNQKWTRN
jgi:hypothetical protein